MKNIYSTISDSPTRLSNTHDGNLNLDDTRYLKDYISLYITSEDEIKDCYVLNIHTHEVYFVKGWYGCQPIVKKIILTTDQLLIDNDIQKIDEEFLQWYVINSDCEYAKLEKGFVDATSYGYNFLDYQIVMPLTKENKPGTKKYTPEEETLEKIKIVMAANNDAQAIRHLEQYGLYRVEQMYSDDDVLNLLHRYQEYIEKCIDRPLISIVPGNWFDNNKK